MLTTGVDIIEIDRVERACERWGARFGERIFTPCRDGLCAGAVPHELAVRFAAKEAVSKALGTGIWCEDGIWWQEIEVLPDARGKPIVHLSGRAQQRGR